MHCLKTSCVSLCVSALSRSRSLCVASCFIFCAWSLCFKSAVSCCSFWSSALASLVLLSRSDFASSANFSDAPNVTTNVESLSHSDHVTYRGVVKTKRAYSIVRLVAQHLQLSGAPAVQRKYFGGLGLQDLLSFVLTPSIKKKSSITIGHLCVTCKPRKTTTHLSSGFLILLRCQRSLTNSLCSFLFLG